MGPGVVLHNIIKYQGQSSWMGNGIGKYLTCVGFVLEKWNFSIWMLVNPFYDICDALKYILDSAAVCFAVCRVCKVVLICYTFMKWVLRNLTDLN